MPTIVVQKNKVELNVTGHKVLEHLSNGKRIPSNTLTDVWLQSGDLQKNPNSYPSWASTIVVNEAPGKRFGKTVESQGVIFKVPKEYQGRGDVALVLDNSTIKLTDGDGEMTGKKMLTAEISKAQAFPPKSGWGIPDENTGIPPKVKSEGKHYPNSHPLFRYLWRPAGARVGPIARGFQIYDTERDVILSFGLDNGLAVTFIAREAEQAKSSKTAIGELTEEVEPSAKEHKHFEWLKRRRRL